MFLVYSFFQCAFLSFKHQNISNPSHPVPSNLKHPLVNLHTMNQLPVIVYEDVDGE